MNGKNSILKLDIEELESDGLPLKLSALKNAARMSKNSPKCCLGPGGDAASNTLPEDSSNSTAKKAETSKSASPKPTVDVPSISTSPKILDYNVYEKFALLKLAEKHRKNLVRKELEEKREEIEAQQKEVNNTNKTQQNSQQEVTANEIKYQIEQIILDEAEKLAAELVIENARRQQQKNEEYTKRIDQLKRQHAEQRQKLLGKQIYDNQREFAEMYEEFGKKFRMLKTIDRMDKLKQQLIQPLMKYNGVDEKLKSNSFDENDLKQTEQMLEDLNSLSIRLDEELTAEIIEATTKSEVDARTAQEIVQPLEQQPPVGEIASNEIQQTAPQQQQQVPTDSVPPKPDNGLSQFVSPENFTFYNNIMSFYTSKVESVKPLQANEVMKKYRSNCQKAINIPVNAISAVSPEHLKDKYDKLYGLISGAKINTSDGPLSVMDHPLGRDFCLLLMAKKFVSQGDSAVSSNPQAAFPIAAVIVAIWQQVPEFGQLFLAYVFKESPYLVPYFIPQVQGQSAEDYFKTLGYRITTEGLEKQDMYLKRQTGLVKLYAAVMVTRTRLAAGPISHPYSIENGWRWLTNLLNLEPLPDICATLIHGFLQITGFEMMRTYRNQFMKLLCVIQSQYLPKLSKIDEGGPKSRLEVFLTKVLNENTIEQPAGLLAPNFW